MRGIDSKVVYDHKVTGWLLAQTILVSFSFIVAPVLNINGGGFGASLGNNLVIGFCFIFVVLIFKKRNIPRVTFSSLVCAFGFFIYSLCVVVLTADLNSLVESLVLIACIISSYVYALYIHRVFRGDAIEGFFKIIFLVAVLWALTLILSFFSSLVEDLLNIFFYREYSRGAHLVELRVPGFHPVGGDGGSMNLALVTLAGVGYLRYLSGLKLTISIVFLFIAMLSTGLAGRSGMFIGLPLLSIAIFSVVRLPAYLKLITALCFALLFFIGLYSFVLYSLNNYASVISLLGYEHPLSRMVRLVNGVVHGGVNSTVIGTLFGRMFEFPSNPLHIIFGTGSFSRYLPSTEMLSGTDVGYLRVLNGVGILGSFLMYLVFVVSFIESLRTMVEKKWLLRLSILVFAFIFIGHLKVEYVNTVTACVLFFSLIFVSGLKRNPAKDVGVSF